MPPRTKIKKEEIINAAVNLVRAEGIEALNARSLAARLASSTQPIFSSFASMDEVRAAVIAEARRLYADYTFAVVAERRYPTYKATGMAYIEFAIKEKELFSLLYMRDRSGESVDAAPEFEALVDVIVDMLSVSREEAKLFHLEMWVFVHGIATLAVTSYLELDLDMISSMITDMFLGLKSRFLSRNGK